MKVLLLTVVVMVTVAVLPASSSECSCRAPKGSETAGFELFPGLHLTREASFCNGTLYMGMP